MRAGHDAVCGWFPAAWHHHRLQTWHVGLVVLHRVCSSICGSSYTNSWLRFQIVSRVLLGL